ncbi:hypothetical protein [Xenorhabdus szentirmaii]|uniref:Uncharacterized protein n=2 Tax=Xenorhabdus szentirmaii TaxID=290112 RepID=W1IYU2_9GAMM|nr:MULTISPECIES: hypothetical protein [Xenorhabdus]MBD2791279.1 hypothetical protein [Xenorhabdus sp. CUL]MBD2802893.1 hypothetical protein [Xenorhabdus sp. M]MBD2821974.1 hypothetical protein [Xenorhabdus sp. 42]MBD2824039.1 hypothetical protein [Xenorhabdus sp. 5]PHM34921.1 hypothetical protein Xsze_01367 [Xenorhabdus szentirmaii DSM 16338]
MVGYGDRQIRLWRGLLTGLLILANSYVNAGEMAQDDLKKIARQENYIEVYGSLVSSPCLLSPSSHDVQVRDHWLQLDLIDCAEGMEAIGVSPFPVNIILSASDSFLSSAKIRLPLPRQFIRQGRHQLKMSLGDAFLEKTNLRLEINYE